MINWLEEFEKFLMDNDCYSEFVVRLLEHENKSLSEYVDNNPYKRDLIFSAFLWNKRFWSDLHFKWTDRFHEILRDN